MEDKDNRQEFVPEYFTWVTMEEQKEKTKKLENMTNKDKNAEKNRKNK